MNAAVNATTVVLIGAAATIIGAVIGAVITGIISYGAGKKAVRDQLANDIKLQKYAQCSQQLENIRDSIRGCLTTHVLDCAMNHDVEYLNGLQKVSENASKQLVMDGLEAKNPQLQKLGNRLGGLMSGYIALTRSLEAEQVAREAVDARRVTVRNESADIIKEADDILKSRALA